MQYSTLGSTGMDVSEIALGCMAFGLGEGDKYDWALDAAESERIIERAIELGVNFFDTANTYNWGNSERVLGSALAEHDRDELVVASKARFASAPEERPNGAGLSRKTIEQELAGSRSRLGLDTIDLYQIHRWDYETPITETLSALTDAVERGHIRTIGASSMWTHQFATARHESDRHGFATFATMQNHYNLVYREEEREMLPFCEGADIAVLPWSPLAAGYLARPHEQYERTDRGRSDNASDRRYADGTGKAINRRVEQLATDHGCSMAQVAIAWLLSTEPVTAPIVGTTSVEHLEEAVEATEIDLSDDDVAFLEEPYEPRAVVGHS